MGYVSPDDLVSESTNLLDQTGVNTGNPSMFTNAADALNPFVTAAEVQGASIPQTSPASSPTAQPSQGLVAQFLAWLDSIFHLNLSRQ